MAALTELAPEQLWIAEMRASRMGFQYGARMTVIRLPEGGLFIHSPIALTDALRAELDSLGSVRHVIAPARFHHQHLAEFARAYPEARTYAVPGTLPQLRQLVVDRVLGDAPEPEWAAVLDQSLFRGSALYDEVDFFHRPTATLILTDLAFCIPSNGSLITRAAARMMGILDRFAPSRSFRFSIRDRRAVRDSLQRILAWEFERIIISHGRIVETQAKETFRQAFARWLNDGQ